MSKHYNNDSKSPKDFSEGKTQFKDVNVVTKDGSEAQLAPLPVSVSPTHIKEAHDIKAGKVDTADKDLPPLSERKIEDELGNLKDHHEHQVNQDGIVNDPRPGTVKSESEKRSDEQKERDEAIKVGSNEHANLKKGH